MSRSNGASHGDAGANNVKDAWAESHGDAGSSDSMKDSAHTWANLPSQLSDAVRKLPGLLSNDTQFVAFAGTNAIKDVVTFGIKSSGSDRTILVTVGDGTAAAEVADDHEKASFTLVALPQQWEQFFKQTPVAPYQSYWGMFGMNIKQRGIQVLGSQDDFNRCAHFWRRTLEVLHDAHAGPTPADEPARDVGDNAGNDEDHIVGRYVYVTAPLWGRCKLFYEQSGAGKQDVLFLHTAGSDSRQYHGVLNDARMRERCHMVAFDLPGHGRSFPSNAHAAGAHTTTEEAYVGCIAAVIKALKLNKPIVCGASMAGQVCLAVAIQAEKVGAGGTIPLQGCDYLDMERTWHDKSPYANQALFNPEWIYGMMAPTAPLVNRQLIWHIYSGQAYGIFHGDLDFYFSGKNGWDGRARMKDIDTKKCPVYMLTGEYDWSNTPAMSQATAEKISGAKHQTMKGLGHFPATENPARFIPYLLTAIEHIQQTRQN